MNVISRTIKSSANYVKRHTSNVPPSPSVVARAMADKRLRRASTRQTSKVAAEGRPGAVALITITVFAAVLVVIGLTVSGIGRNEIVLSGVFRDGENAFSIADACAEEALTRLKSDQGFMGTSFALDGGFCDGAVAHIAGNTYSILATGSYIDNTRIIDVNVTVHFNGQGNAKTVKINSWKEAD